MIFVKKKGHFHEGRAFKPLCPSDRKSLALKSLLCAREKEVGKEGICISKRALRLGGGGIGAFVPGLDQDGNPPNQATLMPIGRALPRKEGASPTPGRNG